MATNYGHPTTVAEVRPMQSSPVERIVGDVVPVVLACGHTAYMNPSMTHRPGDRARCWSTDHG